MVATESKGHSSDLEAPLSHALDDFDHRRALNQVPLSQSDDWSAPVSTRTVHRRLEAADLSERDETHARPNELRSLGRAGLDRTYPVPDDVWDVDCSTLLPRTSQDSPFMENTSNLVKLRSMI